MRVPPAPSHSPPTSWPLRTARRKSEQRYSHSACAETPMSYLGRGAASGSGPLVGSGADVISLWMVLAMRPISTSLSAAPSVCASSSSTLSPPPLPPATSRPATPLPSPPAVCMPPRPRIFTSMSEFFLTPQLASGASSSSRLPPWYSSKVSAGSPERSLASSCRKPEGCCRLASTMTVWPFLTSTCTCEREDAGGGPAAATWRL